ncbi:MAG: VWA domain-containing protein [Anaerolineales bacterium]|nr:VWA domain-containing protein [Anaerolineales bacterium]
MIKWLRKRVSKDQVGQSIVLLALAFIVLVAFIGLVTDISILFVRYGTLRRTVDAAAIAAAGQIREDSDFAALSLTAREFIQLHGLEPHRVFVETCETDVYNWRSGRGAWEGTPHAETDGWTLDQMGNSELCNWESPRKLVRVTAQVESPTFFLKIIGINDITLEASSVSETAVLDVALVIDTSQSMSKYTEMVHYEAVGFDTWGTQPAKVQIRDSCVDTAARTAGSPARNPLTPIPMGGNPIAPVGGYGYLENPLYFRWGACCDDPGRGKIYQREDGVWLIYTDLNFNDQYDSGVDALGFNTGYPSINQADGDYSDLICHPFREVKDAARNFVRRLDYIRGDRISLVTFDADATIIEPEGKPAGTFELMMTSEVLALATLNKKVGVNENYFGGGYGRCAPFDLSYADYSDDGIVNNSTGLNPSFIRPFAYESVVQCPDTNIGGGVRKANDTLTNVVTIRRDAVWVMIFLSDGGANRTDSAPDLEALPGQKPPYGFYGFCPWETFCNNDPMVGIPIWNEAGVECNMALQTNRFQAPYCNDDSPETRHFCLTWSEDEDLNGRPDPMNPNCWSPGAYDADDYAMDWADFAGLLTVAPGIPGNFITMFTIGFGEDITDVDTGATLLRYIADAGDNGYIDNDLQQDWRDNGLRDFSVTADKLGDPGPCELVLDPEEWCGQYYFADNLSSLEAVFEAIASRLFTRIAR